MPFPPLEDHETPVSVSSLKTYIRQFNRTLRVCQARLSIWCATRPTSTQKRLLNNLVDLHLEITDVLSAHLILDGDGDAEQLIVESVKCFGPRETVRDMALGCTC